MAVRYANRMNSLKASEIREILKVTEKPEVISFAGGLPAPELFPVEEMREVASLVLAESGRQALQYATTEGFGPLRQKLADRMNRKLQTNVTADDILITSGSQQGLDFTGKVFLDEGDIVLCESPSYLGAINAFKAYGPKFVEVPTDDEGLISSELKEILEKVQPKCIYVIPDFQNPTGRSWTLKRRQEFMEIINHYEIPVIEDNPYGELNFEGEILPSLKSMDTKGLVIFLGTFSKIFCPGYRIGWVAASQEILEKYIMIKQSADLHTSSISQREIDKYLELYDIDENIAKIKEVYRKRRDLMLAEMEKEFPDNVKFTYPKGGLFTWVELPAHVDAREVLLKCVENNVAFVPGGSFYPNGGNENTFRLNYSNMQEDKIVEGIQRLGKILREVLQPLPQ
ncbi:PLP-dependent aminotransferase family protein [Brevibacillus fulvus]|uniref:2-aminoadipate transaminase n=1 Tax=Brevibacillus fulvus TaxID=1125967 RepID=A0A938XX01_9BACL|nr:PLP-dependent aminotransferase family protein [Brevibacillus fulvus]MBM7589436.1 2-aminoadipate transaminase [Brevibacillus fulvus]